MTDLHKHNVVQLRARRRRLARSLGSPETTLFGSLLTQGRKCGKEGCRCAMGELHGPYVYVSLRKPRGRGGSRVFVCEGAGPRTTTLAEEWTDRVGLPAPRALNYERLADLVKTLSTIRDD